MTSMRGSATANDLRLPRRGAGEKTIRQPRPLLASARFRGH
jgi:hypothetical protein